jgi:RNA polymerase sigma factor for flagellar operon FliA
MTIDVSSAQSRAPSPYGCLDPDLGAEITKECIEHHIPRAARRLRMRLPEYIRLDELISAGCLALAQCFQRYRAMNSHSSKAEFYAYFNGRLEGAMLDYLREQDSLSRDLRAFEKRKEVVCCVWFPRGVSHPSSQQMADELGVDLERYFHLMDRARLLDSIHAARPVEGEDDQDGGVGDGELFVEDALLEVWDRRSLLDLAIKTLSPRQQQILGWYYFDGRTLREIGEVLGVTESRVSQLHTEAIRALRVAAHVRIDAVIPRVARSSLPLPVPPPPRKGVGHSVPLSAVTTPPPVSSPSSPVSPTRTEICLDIFRRRCSKQRYQGKKKVHTPRALLGCYPPHLVGAEADRELASMESQGLIRWVQPRRQTDSRRRPAAFIVLL